MTNKEAIEILTKIRISPKGELFTEIVGALDLAIKALELVNDSQDLVNDLVKERPKGRWHFRCEGLYIFMSCSICHNEYSRSLFPKNFCPNCGADMREADDETD